jgi:hypothetical protein
MLIIKPFSIVYRRKGGVIMKVKTGDKLMCTCENCSIELTVTKACDAETCDAGCDMNATCCGKPMELKK